MQAKISGEQPFQVLSTSFTIGPSSSGYDLYFSADGKSYTNLFTVGANVNRQVTQVAAGSYYKLVGNTDDVIINWILNCESGSGGGGGSYILPPATDSTLGGVKIGSGITVTADGTISAEGGSGAPSYIINDVLTGTAEEIQAFYNAIAPLVSGSSLDGISIYYRSRALGTTENLTLCTNAWFQHAQDFGIDSVVFRFDIENYAQIGGETLPDTINIDIKSDGTVETYSGASSMIPSTTCVYIGPNGDFWGHRNASFLYDEGQQFKLAVKGCEGDFSAEYGFGSIVYARKVTVSDVTTYTWSLIVPTDTGVMKGVWHTTDLNDTTNYVLDSWTAL